MRRLFRVCLLTMLLPACKEPAAGPSYDLDAIRVSVQVQPSTVQIGSEATVVLTLRNTITRPVEISSCPIYFWVQSGSGDVVGGSNLIFCAGTSLLYLPLRFEPLETKTLSYTWIPGETEQVPPGLYDVFGWVNEPDHRSAPARVTVQPAN